MLIKSAGRGGGWGGCQSRRLVNSELSWLDSQQQGSHANLKSNFHDFLRTKFYCMTIFYECGSSQKYGRQSRKYTLTINKTSLKNKDGLPLQPLTWLVFHDFSKEDKSPWLFHDFPGWFQIIGFSMTVGTLNKTVLTDLCETRPAGCVSHTMLKVEFRFIWYQ